MFRGRGTKADRRECRPESPVHMLGDLSRFSAAQLPVSEGCCFVYLNRDQGRREVWLLLRHLLWMLLSTNKQRKGKGWSVAKAGWMAVVEIGVGFAAGVDRENRIVWAGTEACEERKMLGIC